MTKILWATSAFFVLGVSAIAAPAAPKHPAPKPVKATPLVCAVTGDKIASVKDAAGKSVYKGKTYYFCCPSCKPEFDKDPAKYAKKMAAVSSSKKPAMENM